MARIVIAAGFSDALAMHLNIACQLAGSVVCHDGYWTAIERLADVLPDRGGVFRGKKAIKVLATEPWEPGALATYASTIEQAATVPGD
jgi:hypothetical protein